MSQQRKNHHKKNTSTGNINSDDADPIYNINDNSGDLSAWEYLTKNYDDSQLNDDDAESFAPSKIAMNINTCQMNIPVLSHVQHQYKMKLKKKLYNQTVFLKQFQPSWME
jgi:hypothetical protein